MPRTCLLLFIPSTHIQPQTNSTSNKNGPLSRRTSKTLPPKSVPLRGSAASDLLRHSGPIMNTEKGRRVSPCHDAYCLIFQNGIALDPLITRPSCNQSRCGVGIQRDSERLAA